MACFGLKGVALRGLGAEALTHRQDFVFEHYDLLCVCVEVGLLALTTSFEFLRLSVARGETFVERSDLFRLQFQSAAGAFGFKIQRRDSSPSSGEFGFRAIAGLLNGGVLALLLHQLRGDLLEVNLRMTEVV